MRDEGFGQQPYRREIHQDRLPVLVDAEVAGLHVGLHSAPLAGDEADLRTPLLRCRKVVTARRPVPSVGNRVQDLQNGVMGS